MSSSFSSSILTINSCGFCLQRIQSTSLGERTTINWIGGNWKNSDRLAAFRTVWSPDLATGFFLEVKLSEKTEIDGREISVDGAGDDRSSSGPASLQTLFGPSSAP
jgi:hypothetical protein